MTWILFLASNLIMYFLTRAVKLAVVKTTKPKSSSDSKSKKDAMTSSCVDFVFRDIRPFDMVNGTGFIEVIQEVSSFLSVLNARQ